MLAITLPCRMAWRSRLQPLLGADLAHAGVGGHAFLELVQVLHLAQVHGKAVSPAQDDIQVDVGDGDFLAAQPGVVGQLVVGLFQHAGNLGAGGLLHGVLDGLVLGPGRGAEELAEGLVDIGVQEGQPAPCAGLAFDGVAAEEPCFGEARVQVGQDGHVLGQHQVTVHQQRHGPLGVHGQVGRFLGLGVGDGFGLVGLADPLQSGVGHHGAGTRQVEEFHGHLQGTGPVPAGTGPG